MHRVLWNTCRYICTYILAYTPTHSQPCSVKKHSSIFKQLYYFIWRGWVRFSRWKKSLYYLLLFWRLGSSTSARKPADIFTLTWENRIGKSSSGPSDVTSQVFSRASRLAAVWSVLLFKLRFISNSNRTNRFICTNYWFILSINYMRIQETIKAYPSLTLILRVRRTRQNNNNNSYKKSKIK